MDPTLIADLKARDRERFLATLYAPARARAAMLAVHAYDLEQERVVAEVREPLLAEIRLAWWREQLEQLAAGRLAPPQPLLRALRHDARARGVDLTRLTQIEEGFLPLLTDGPLDPLALAAARGRPLFRALMAAILGHEPAGAQAAAADAGGTLYALARLWRGAWGAAEARLAAAPVPAPLPGGWKPLPPPLRALVALAADDLADRAAGRPLRPAGGAGRQWRMIRTAL